MPLEQLARALLDVLQGGPPPPGGLAFRTALGQARLDASPEAVARLDRLLAEVRARFQPRRADWLAQPGVPHFMLLACFYLGDVIAREAGLPVRWMTREEALASLPVHAHPPAEDWARVVGLVGETLCMPLGVVEDRLFGTPPQLTCVEYVGRMLARVRSHTAADEEARCVQYLRTLSGGAPPPGGLAFATELVALTLDHSAASLQQLDALLHRLRAERRPAYEVFVNLPDTQNFLRWVGFYTGVTIARIGHLPLRWLNYEALRRHVPDVAFEFETSCACVLGERLYFPLGVATEMLFDAAPRRDLSGLAQHVLAG